LINLEKNQKRGYKGIGMRVLSPGGTPTMSKINWKGIRKTPEGYPVTWTFKLSLLRLAYTKNEFKQFVSRIPFKKREITENLIGLEIWLER